MVREIATGIMVLSTYMYDTAIFHDLFIGTRKYLMHQYYTSCGRQEYVLYVYHEPICCLDFVW